MRESVVGPWRRFIAVATMAETGRLASMRASAFVNGMNQIGAVVMLSRAIIFASGIVLSVALATTAFAQAGSAGGTIGLRDKSVSGGGEAPSALH